ncbi:Uncharacterised protein [Pseudomonas aeruginosa]|nr:Uncharacterised protein [Pseudomonas aeruginosa]
MVPAPGRPSVSRRDPAQVPARSTDRRSAPVLSRPGDEPGEQVGDFLPEQHRVVVVVQRLQPQENRRQARHTAQLATLQRLEDVQDLVRRDAVELVVAAPGRSRIAGMALPHPVGNPAANGVELDSRAHHVAAAGLEIAIHRDEVRREHLQLQRYRQAVLRPPVAAPHEALARFLDHPRDDHLQAVEIGTVIRVRLVYPVLPQQVQRLAQRRVVQACARRNAGADQVADALADRARGVGVIPHRRSRALAQGRQCRNGYRIQRRLGRVPACGAASGASALVAVANALRRDSVSGSHQIPLPPL